MAGYRQERARTDEAWRAVAAEQAGAISREQAVASGLTAGAVDALLRAGRWSRLHPGVYATFAGPVPARTRTWAALLHAGAGAVLSGESALWVWGVRPRPPEVVQVQVPNGRKVVPAPGVRIVRRRRLARLVHPSAVPARLRLEEVVLDLAGESDEAGVVDVVLLATGSRQTTSDKLRAALAARPRHRHRQLLKEILGEVAEGVQSALERRFRRTTERAHGLPLGERQLGDALAGRTGAPRKRYRDIRYRRWRLVVELDGLEAHPERLKWQSRLRDNSVVVTSDDQVLQYGWREVVSEPCAVASDIVQVLWRHGWRGRPVPCGAGCPIERVLGLPAV